MSTLNPGAYRGHLRASLYHHADTDEFVVGTTVGRVGRPDCPPHKPGCEFDTRGQTGPQRPPSCRAAGKEISRRHRRIAWTSIRCGRDSRGIGARRFRVVRAGAVPADLARGATPDLFTSAAITSPVPDARPIVPKVEVSPAKHPSPPRYLRSTLVQFVRVRGLLTCSFIVHNPHDTLA